MHPARRRLAAFLSAAMAAVAAVAALVLPAGPPSAAAVSVARNGVGAIHPETILLVGASRQVSAGEGRCGRPAQPGFAAGACVAAEDAGASGATQLFRTVGSAEARDIGESGVYRNPAGLEGKYFYPTQAQAENLGAQYSKLGLGEQTLTSGRISTDLLSRFGEPIEPAGEGSAFFLRNEFLPYISDVNIEGPLP